MKRFILSAFSVLLATVAVAPTAQALSKVDPAFTLQALRLSEFDTRNKSDENQHPYYPQASTHYPQVSTQPYPQNVSAEQDNAQMAEPTLWEETPENPEEASSPALSLTQQRHQSLDRS